MTFSYKISLNLRSFCSVFPFELFHFENIREAVTVTELLITFNKKGVVTCILGDMRSGRCAVPQAVGIRVQESDLSQEEEVSS